MAVKNKSKGYPFLVGLDHDNPSSRLVLKLYDLIDKQATKGGTLFVEGWPSGLKEEMKSKKVTDIFGAITFYAQSKGMKIVPLDRDLTLKVNAKRETYGDKRHRYWSHDLRERGWVHKLRAHAKKGDIVLAHPEHIDGLVNRGYCGEGDILLKQQYGEPQRLKPLERAEFESLRKKEKIKRRKKMRIIFFIPRLFRKIRSRFSK